MNKFLQSFLFGVLVLALVQPMQAQGPGIGDLLDFIDDLNGYGDGADKALDVADEIMDTYDNCLEQGYSPETCESAALLCGTYELLDGNLPGVTGDAIDNLGLMELFKPNCGDGVCFQCCWSPSPTGGGCHTSFIGYPVINCNENYGPGTHPAGITLLLGGEPGDPCISIPQVCIHIPICSLGEDEATITMINNDPDHVMKSTNAVQQRARHYAEDFMESWADFINDFSTGEPLVANGDTILQELTFKHLADFLTVRGGLTWSAFLDSLSTFDGLIEPFQIVDSTTLELASEPSMWNYFRQLGLGNLLAATPNLYDRLAYTGSKIWLEDDLNAYLEPINYSDSLFQASMSPIAFYFYKTNRKIQDYRVLSVPLMGEMVQEDYWMGHTLGEGPHFEVTTGFDESNEAVSLTIEVVNANMVSDPVDQLDGLIYWGDGTTTHFQLPSNQETASFEHAFEQQGFYQAFVLMQNNTGLRAVQLAELEMETASGNAPLEVPVPYKFVFDSLTIQTSLFTFVDEIGVNVRTEIDQVDVLIGAKSARSISNNVYKSYGDLVAYNGNLESLDFLILEPRILDEPGDDAATAYLAFQKLTAQVYDAASNEMINIDLPVSVDHIQLEDEFGNILNTEDYLSIAADGRVQIQFALDDLDIAKIYITIDHETLKLHYIEARPQLDFEEKNNFYLEQKPDHFMPFDVNSTSVAEASKSNVLAVRAYPNPTKGTVILEFHPDYDQEAKHISVLSPLGQVLKQINCPAHQQQFFLRLDDFPVGTYFLQIEQGGNVASFKVVKL